MSSGVQAVIGAGGAEVPRILARVETRMVELASGHGPLLGRHASATIAAGGKRLRPLLVCLTAGVPVPAGAAVVRSAVAVELIHAASLVHDDVLDRADLRRGRPTVVATAGRRVATATGDLLFSRAFSELALTGSPRAIQSLSQACAGLAAGELMQRSDAFDPEVSLERYLDRCRLKTAVLFRAACELGELAGGSGEPALGEFGERIGMAFQILDDILDISGPSERTGKLPGTDLLDGTVTLPLIIARKLDPALADLPLAEIRTAGTAAEACARIAATGALERSRRRALAFVAEAKALLAEVDEPRRVALELVADGVVDRYA